MMILRLKGIISPRPVGVIIGESRLLFSMLSRGTALLHFYLLGNLQSWKNTATQFVLTKKQLKGEGELVLLVERVLK